MSQKQGQDASNNYMDGVSVKISEKYKPPPRITLAMTYSQRISMNKQIQDSLPKYDFKLEKSVKNRMKELREAKEIIAANKNEQLEKIKCGREKLLKEREKDDSVNTDANARILQPTIDILTPTPMSNDVTYMNVPKVKNSFNISDFEADTSSPFDNMELKTINDLEELAKVLKNDKSVAGQDYISNQSTYPVYQSSQNSANVNQYSYQNQIGMNTPLYNSSCSNTNGYYYTTDMYSTQVGVHSSIKPAYNIYLDNKMCEMQPQTSKAPLKTIPDIMHDLEMVLTNTRLNNTPKHSTNSNVNENVLNLKKNIPNSISDNNQILDPLGNPYENLPHHLQNVCKAVNAMGFPLSRVARACKEIGDDQKKIVEHLLTLSELLDLGFPEESVSSALLRCNNDRDKALEFLIL